jgi:hypothetical protein
MRIQVDPEARQELLEFLRRADCEARAEGEDSVLVEVPDALGDEQARLEVDLYLKAWQASHPDVEIEAQLLENPQSGVEADAAKADWPRDMRRLLAFSAAGFSLLAVQPALATIRPQHGMSGVVLGMTKAQVQRSLGRPVGIGGGRFYYARVWVGFRAGRAVDIATTRSTERMANGLGVDSSESAVRRALPGVVCAPWSVFRRCRLGSGAPGTRVTDFTIGQGHVLQVTISLLPG